MREKPSLLVQDQAGENNVDSQIIGSTSEQLPLELTYDQRSFMLNGERVFLNSATIHYFRMPKEEWRQLLVKAKLAGMNCIDTYFAWNVHEPEEGQWNFEGDNDCGAFLDLCAELGMWVIARPGPFICAEWDFGGFPYWLETKSDIKFRENNETYLHYVDLYFDQLVPIIRERQLSSGGNVILVQVENEYGYIKDDEAASEHMIYLRDGLIKRGIDVPLITCVGGAEGTIEGANFWSGADGHYEKLRAKQPDTPKMVTEFWTGWFENWGGPSAIQKTPALLERRIMEILQTGYTGISHYMFFGGTNFGGYGGRTIGSSDIFMITSYDYDAPLNEYGRVTEKYAVTKTVSYFVDAFRSLLLESEAVPTEQIKIRHPEGLSVRGRTADNQHIWFVESHKGEREGTTITFEDGRTLPITVNPGQIIPVLDRVRLADNVYVTSGAMITGNEMINGELNLFISADSGQRSVLDLEAPALEVVSSSMQVLVEKDPARDLYRFDLFHFREPGIIRLQAGNVSIRLIVLDRESMNRTWRLDGVHTNEHRYAVGFDEVQVLPQGQVKGSISDLDRTVVLLGDWQDGEQMWTGREFITRTEASQQAVSNSSVAALTPPVAPILSGSPEVARVKLVADQRPSSGQPEHFSQYGQDFGYLLYECDFESPEGGMTHIVLPDFQDTARIYVNQVEQALVRQVGAAGVNIEAAQGHNTLQILVQHMGRLNFSPNLGESKGLAGHAYLGGSVQDIRQDWQTTDGSIQLNEVNHLTEAPLLSRSFELDGNDRAILVGAVSKGLRVNGTEVPMEGYHDWFSFATVDLSSYLRQGEVNTLEMPYSKSPIERLELILYRNADELSGWRMAGNDALLPQQWETQEAGSPSSLLGEHAATTGNRTANQGAGQPAWYRWNFNMPAVSEQYVVNVKVRLTGMSKGTLHLNGHDLGRYWQIGPQEDYKIPVAWLQEENELLLFDEEGRSPDRIRLLFDEPSRYPWVSIK
ncbi:beta-galactosidase [Bacillales bacterium AN1005]